MASFFRWRLLGRANCRWTVWHTWDGEARGVVTARCGYTEPLEKGDYDWAWSDSEPKTGRRCGSCRRLIAGVAGHR